mmetsp:Transcript_7840/g.11278  ORF Transcript_7840/g.11278 Transcript_7840/m.11278 type:complete len:203 (+) Transcript_7840:1-609(+)
MDNYCTDYSTFEQDVLFDGMWRTARAFSGMADFFGFCTMVFALIMACMASHPKFVRNLALGCLFVGFLSIWMLLGLSSKICTDLYECKMGRGGYYSIIGTSTWFLTAILMTKIPPPTTLDSDGEEQRPINLNFEEEIGNNNGAGGDEASSPQVELTPKLPPGSVTQTETTLPDGTVQHTLTTVNKDGTKTVSTAPKKENEIV